MLDRNDSCYGVATISRLLEIIGLLCKRALQKRLCSAKETYNLKEPTNRSYPISVCTHGVSGMELYRLRLVGSLQL